MKTYLVIGHFSSGEVICRDIEAFDPHEAMSILALSYAEEGGSLSIICAIEGPIPGELTTPTEWGHSADVTDCLPHLF